MNERMNQSKGFFYGLTQTMGTTRSSKNLNPMCQLIPIRFSLRISFALHSFVIWACRHVLLLALAIAIAGCSNIQGRRAFDEAAWKRLCEVRKLALEEMHNRNIDPAKCIEAGFEYRDSKWLLVYLGEHHTDHFVISVDANNHVNFAPGL
jgi:hypothetical protein